MPSTISQYAWIVPLFPLAAFLALTALGRQAKKLGAAISLAAGAASFALALAIYLGRLRDNAADFTWNSWTWLKAGDFTLTMGYEVTNLNVLMLLLVSSISLLVLIYSCGYMAEDERFTVFHGYVSLFAFSMLSLTLSVNLIQFYLFWELVGACSFLLIGFWYRKPEARAAAKKAFLMTRIGDMGLFFAILLLYWNMPSHALEFTSLQNAFPLAGGAAGDAAMSAGLTTAIALLIFLGAMGKSGQFPLHAWLPDAMEGPTPISALIHAATMVAAGVYLIARTYPIFLHSTAALDVMAGTGAFTALFAALLAIGQNDLKRVLAYSTVSQLGYMMLALGLGSYAAYTAGISHLFTHAFFKALLFLAAGCVIHAVHTQDIRQMGGLAGKLKTTAWTFGIGALALSGIPPFSGFWSKDAILAEAYQERPFLFAVALLTAVLTAFYMARLVFLVFFGPGRGEGQSEQEALPRSMTAPLIALAVPAAIAGFLFLPGTSSFGRWLTSQEFAHDVDWTVLLLSTVAGLLGIGLGYLAYGRGSRMEGRFLRLGRAAEEGFYVDAFYERAIIAPVKGFGFVLELFDRYVIGGAVKLVALAVMQLHRLGTRLQNGRVQTYGLVTLLGLVAMLLIYAGRRFWHVG
ncbi:NADH-quinone oxidoreductase subunit L [Gorillibacterium timonense]|uniref:NADH-quinone oxidoreductase subunit L n=1 Tax=Gorillibacterium timonense TaxID=1689269 RepID=UPI00071E355C|nr:NADH-quinone oxidoreductase subunit L [Gorillibacterium timonense]